MRSTIEANPDRDCSPISSACSRCCVTRKMKDAGEQSCYAIDANYSNGAKASLAMNCHPDRSVAKWRASPERSRMGTCGSLPQPPDAHGSIALPFVFPTGVDLLELQAESRPGAQLIPKESAGPKPALRTAFVWARNPTSLRSGRIGRPQSPNRWCC
jgi:hypothetical protein